MRSPQTEDVFKARIVAARDLVDEAHDECSATDDDAAARVLFGIARDALDALVYENGDGAEPPTFPERFPERGEACGS